MLPELTDAEALRYNRQIVLRGFDFDGQEKLKAALPHYDHVWEGEIDGTLSVYIGSGVLGAAVQVLD